MMAARIKQIQAFMALTQMLVLPLFFLSGALYPLNGLPDLADGADPDRSADLHRGPDAARGLRPPVGQPAGRCAALSPGVTWDGWLVPLGLSWPWSPRWASRCSL